MWVPFTLALQYAITVMGNHSRILVLDQHRETASFLLPDL